jgi:hypothetical protein
VAHKSSGVLFARGSYPARSQLAASPKSLFDAHAVYANLAAAADEILMANAQLIDAVSRIHDKHAAVEAWR